MISEAVLGLFLKFIQAITELKVYTLLLNIDFLYNKYLPESLEFSLHLIVSIIISVVYVFFSEKLNLDLRQQFVFFFVFTTPTVYIYIPLSIFSIKETPALSDGLAILWWMIGHFLFALLLPLLFNQIKQRF
ncbi:hypothetical protein [Metabacillus bambusae]|uniref:Uncharacterized protein n=1 Tax=Metabacillus bambusae TaxID=2795218 RepID=A0ABS3MX41_9BACI|nr:hypothetical protein [Metabacillus bambusae]MBO1510569.1 hypothetical protein [Metabacillus bambusae]